jgi:LmbE family N-acetylglucosaminyl deacetylase
LIFTHQRDDLHQDHRVIGELTWNTFRNDLILEYEIPKYEGGLSTPTVYIGLSKAEVERKIRIILGCYASQRSKAWFSAETLRGLMRLRGIESGATSGWAEGFHGRKLLIG